MENDDVSALCRYGESKVVRIKRQRERAELKFLV